MPAIKTIPEDATEEALEDWMQERDGLMQAREYFRSKIVARRSPD